MNFEAEIEKLMAKIAAPNSKRNEAVTKQSLILPLITAWGYDPHDADEVCPEYTADHGTKKGEKVDYAILRDNCPLMFIECKPAYEELTDKYESQLHRYFSVTSECRVAILTNGIRYKFFSDFEKPNVLDNIPFFEIDLRNITNDQIDILKRFSKSEIDINKLIPEARKMLRMRNVMSILNTELERPSEDHVRAICLKCHRGKITQNIINEYTPLVKQAFSQIVNDRAATMLKKTAEDMEKEVKVKPHKEAKKVMAGPKPTEEEIIGFDIVRAICMSLVSAERVFIRKNETYCSVLLDDNNRKTLLRMYFNNRNRKFIATIDADKKEKKTPIDMVPEISKVKDNIRESVKMYMGSKDQSD